MRFALVIALAVLVVVLTLGFIGWITGGAAAALVAGFLLLMFVAVAVAARANILTIPPIVLTIMTWAAALCLIVILWASGTSWWKERKAKAKLDAKHMANATMCKNEDGDWVKIPGGHYKDEEGECVEGTPPPTPASSGTSVTQLPDCPTPCKLRIIQIHDLYTDGEPIYALPPGWARENAVLYPGRGRMTLKGPGIGPGEWEFWSADPAKVVQVRVFAR